MHQTISGEQYLRHIFNIRVLNPLRLNGFQAYGGGYPLSGSQERHKQLFIA